MSKALKRLLRVAFSVVIAGLIAEFGDSALYLGIAPIISALGKLIRTRWPEWNWIPF